MTEHIVVMTVIEGKLQEGCARCGLSKLACEEITECIEGM